MKIEIKVPAMGESITEVTIGTILKPSGSAVSPEDELLELETDKVNQILYAPEGGVVSLNVSQDETVKIGQVIGYIDTEAKAKEESKPEEPKPSEKKKVKEATESKEIMETKTTQVSKAPPKEEAKETNLKKVEPKTDAPVRFGKEEFSASLKAPVTTSARPAPVSTVERRETRQRMSKIRRVIADRLVTAQQTSAMLTTFNEIDLSEVITLREKYKESFQKKYGVKLGFMSFFVKASVAALKEVPSINSYIDGDEIVHREYFDLGIAVGTEKGLVVPVVRNCDTLSVSEIEAEIERYAKKAREGTISVDDLQGGGFTITNGGTYGSLLSTPILNPPQCGILGMHKIVKRPVVVDDQIVIRPMMYVALSYDHRIVDGKEAVTFLVHIKNVLEDPARFFLEI